MYSNNGDYGGTRGGGCWRGNRRDGGFRGRGGRGGRGGGYSDRPRRTHFPLRQIVKITDADKLAIRVMSQVDAFGAFLSLDSMSMDHTSCLLVIVSRVTESDLHRESVLKILQAVCSSRFLDLFLLNFVNSELPRYQRQQMREYVNCICQLTGYICSKIPSSASKVYVLLSSLSLVPHRDPELEGRTTALLQQAQQLMQSQTLQSAAGLRANRSSRRRNRPTDDDEAPPEDFTQLPIFPCERDMNTTERVFLRANKVEGAFDDTNHYLDVQFRLLREDYIRPLREGIREFKRNKANGLTQEKSQDMRIYHGVRIIDLVCDKSLDHLVRFQMTPQLNKIQWESSKRLIFGSLVCLSMDDFDTIYYAVITDRKINNVRKGIIQIRFEDDLEKILCLPTNATFTMAESPAFFEAYRHVLEGLQEMQDEVPMSDYLVHCNPQVQPPEYLNNGQRIMALDSLLKSGNCTDVEVMKLNRWPELQDTMLNASQLNAMQTALTKKLAIIQGPPGTGKTYVGLKVTKILLENSHVWSYSDGQRPILVVCYTNHALDQLLEGILDFCPEGIIRVGGRCTSEKLEPFNLKKIRVGMRRKATLSVKNSIRDCLRRQREQKTVLMQASARLMATSNTNIISVEALDDYMLPGQNQMFATETMLSWLTAGLDRSGQLEGSYSELAEEVTQQILHGGDTPSSKPEFNPNMSPNMRARLYSLQRLLDQLQADDSVEEPQHNVEEEAFLIQNARMLDDDDVDEDQRQVQSRKQYAGGAMLSLGAKPIGHRAVSSTHRDGWTTVVNTKRRDRKLQRLLIASEPMTREEAEHTNDLCNLSVEERVRLYLFWLEGLQENLRAQVVEITHRYDQETRQLTELRLEMDKEILSQATVIGMTTTGAARYRRVLNSVACPIVILEEAAEVLEAHVVTSLNVHCEHVILIGDHQQLRPNPTVYDLSVNYNMGISLFERLVKNHLPHAPLKVQHRMRPEVANLVRHVYPELKDHATTMGRPHIRGVQQDVVLFHHEVQEKSSLETGSRSNQHEAELCVRLCRYLLQQEYPPEKITILAAYSGQVSAFRRIMKTEQEDVRSVRVTSVDNYQGEENDIIILSLVRNNQEGSVGFLGTDNRVCVALSRARNGLYVFGNFRILAAGKRGLWKKICNTAVEHGQMRTDLVLRCENHPDKLTVVKTAKDFDKVPEGGCNLPCNHVLKCGHQCELKCHVYDPDHEQYECRKSCKKVFCEEGHRCVKKCYQDCGEECLTLVLKTIPRCGHSASMECNRELSSWYCEQPCQKELVCGHQCSGICRRCDGYKHPRCSIEMEKEQPCGHFLEAPCYVGPGELPCTKPCKVTLQCDHVCQGVCGKCSEVSAHVPCSKPCSSKLACGHVCTGVCSQCSMRKMHSPCKKPCSSKLACGHVCFSQCGTCSTKKAHAPCNKRCKRLLPNCGHKCRGLSRNCWAESGRSPKHAICKKKCGRTLPGCTHRCQLGCGVRCLPCTADSCKVKNLSQTSSPRSAVDAGLPTSTAVAAASAAPRLSGKKYPVTHALGLETTRKRLGSYSSASAVSAAKFRVMNSEASDNSSKKTKPLQSASRTPEAQSTSSTESRQHSDTSGSTRSLPFTRSLGIPTSVDLAVVMKEIRKVLQSNGCRRWSASRNDPLTVLYRSHGQPATDSYVFCKLRVVELLPDHTHYGVVFEVTTGTRAASTAFADRIVSELKRSV